DCRANVRKRGIVGVSNQEDELELGIIKLEKGLEIVVELGFHSLDRHRHGDGGSLRPRKRHSPRNRHDAGTETKEPRTEPPRPHGPAYRFAQHLLSLPPPATVRGDLIVDRRAKEKRRAAQAASCSCKSQRVPKSQSQRPGLPKPSL